eukprot:2330832-Prorocentrum_lima.AAC.1
MSLAREWHWNSFVLNALARSQTNFVNHSTACVHAGYNRWAELWLKTAMETEPLPAKWSLLHVH